MAVPTELSPESEKGGVGPDAEPAATAPAEFPGAPLLAAVRHGAAPLAAAPGGAPPLAGTPSTSTTGAIVDAGVPAAVPGGGASTPTHVVALHEAAMRFLRGRKMVVHQARSSVFHGGSDSAGSRYWEQNPLPDDNIDGINPPDFLGLHPVWEGFAVPVKRKAKQLISTARSARKCFMVMLTVLSCI